MSTIEDTLENLETAVDDLSNVDIALEQRIAELEATVYGNTLHHVFHLVLFPVKRPQQWSQ